MQCYTCFKYVDPRTHKRCGGPRTTYRCTVTGRQIPKTFYACPEASSNLKDVVAAVGAYLRSQQYMQQMVHDSRPKKKSLLERLSDKFGREPILEQPCVQKLLSNSTVHNVPMPSQEREPTSDQSSPGANALRAEDNDYDEPSEHQSSDHERDVYDADMDYGNFAGMEQEFDLDEPGGHQSSDHEHDVYDEDMDYGHFAGMELEF